MKYIREKINLDIYKLNTTQKYHYWQIFKKHHYLSSCLNKSALCFVGIWNNKVVCFDSALTFPNRWFKNGYREHRLVVLCDYQGLGFGNAMSEFVGEYLLRKNKRFFSKTANIKLGEYRNNSKKWRKTAKNMQSRSDLLCLKKNYKNIANSNLFDRVCYSHEYIGNNE